MPEALVCSAWKYSISSMPTLEPKLKLRIAQISFRRPRFCMYPIKIDDSLTFFSYRIPSNPSVGSKGSYKISTDSIGRNSDRSSPLPSYHVEVVPLQYLELFMFVSQIHLIYPISIKHIFWAKIWHNRLLGHTGWVSNAWSLMSMPAWRAPRRSWGLESP